MCCAPAGADDLTDAPNFGTKFGRRRPCPRYGGLFAAHCQHCFRRARRPGVPFPGCPERGVVAGDDLQQSTPIFFLAPQKESDGGAVERKSAFSLCNPDAPRPLAQRDAALNGPTQLSQPLREHGRGCAETSGHGTPCCTLRSSGQRPNLTSFSFRAFRFAKRCPSGRGSFLFFP